MVDQDDSAKALLSKHDGEAMCFNSSSSADFVLEARAARASRRDGGGGNARGGGPERSPGMGRRLAAADPKANGYTAFGWGGDDCARTASTSSSAPFSSRSSVLPLLVGADCFTADAGAGTGGKRDWSRSLFVQAVPPRQNPRQSEGCFHLPMDGLLPEDFDIVHFSSPVFYCDDGQHHVTIDIIRFGALATPCAVRWKTLDSAAKGMVHYIPCEQEVHFRPGQAEASITIQVIPDPTWQPHLEFQVQLAEPSHCTLGLYLNNCRVKIIDNDVFPTNAYRFAVKKGAAGIQAMSKTNLTMDFFALVWCVRGARWRTVLMILLDQLWNFYLYFVLKATIYMADVLFVKEEASINFLGVNVGLLVPNNREATALVLAISYVVPMAILHVWELCKPALNLSGVIRDYFRMSLFRVYLYSNERARECTKPSNVISGLLQDVPAVAEGYMSLLKLTQVLAQVGIMMYFTISESTGRKQSCFIMALMPSLMIAFFVMRASGYAQAVDKHERHIVDMMRVVEESGKNFNLIAEYRQRPAALDKFRDSLMTMRAAKVPREQLETNNTYFLRIMGPFFTGIYIASAAPGVFVGSLSFGTFLAISGIFCLIADNLEDIWQVIMSLNALSGKLMNLTALYNLEHDLQHEAALYQDRKKRTLEERVKALAEQVAGDTFGQDNIPFRLIDLSFGYDSAHFQLYDVNLVIPQGQLIAVMSDEGAGRSTVLRVLGQQYVPKSGHTFYPTYYRICHLNPVPMLFPGSVWKNLTFGNPDIDLASVITILEELGLEQTKKRLLLETGARDFAREGSSGSSQGGGREVGEQVAVAVLGLGAHQKQEGNSASRWQSTCSESEKAKIGLARAFVMNAEVLVLHRPLAPYSEHTGSRAHVLSVLRRYVENRGLGDDRSDFLRRRPRTCFFTPEAIEEALQADLVLTVRGDGSLVSRPGLHGKIPEHAPESSGELGIDAMNDEGSLAEWMGLHRHDGKKSTLFHLKMPVAGRAAPTEDGSSICADDSLFASARYSSRGGNSVDGQPDVFTAFAGDLFIGDQIPIPGLSVYRSKHFQDVDVSRVVAWGEVVLGVDEGDGWLNMQNGQYLTTMISGVCVLRHKEVDPMSKQLLERQQQQQQVQGEERINRRSRKSEKHKDIVQFAAQIFYVDEDEGELRIDIMRLGSMSGALSVTFETQATTAHAGVHFEHKEGCVLFDDGQADAHISIRILVDPRWAPTLEFKVVLTQPIGCELDLYLHTCRVKVINTDTFPTNAHHAQIMSGEVENISQTGLVWEYIKMIWTIEGVAWRTVLTVLLDQLSNTYLYFTLIITVYYTNVLFAEDLDGTMSLPMTNGGTVGMFVPGDREATAVLLGFMFFCPILLIHLLEYTTIKLDLRGRCVDYLRVSLFTKYLNYDEHSRRRVKSSDIQTALVQDVPEVGNCYVEFINLIRSAGRVLINVLFIIHKSPQATAIVAVMPLLMGLFVALRAVLYLNVVRVEGDKFLRVIDFVTETCGCFELVASYQQRPQMCKLMQEKTDAMRAARVNKQIFEVNNQFFAKHLGPLFTAIYIAFMSRHVWEGTLGMGAFLATVDAIASISEAFSGSFASLMSISSSLRGLQGLVDLVNLPTDLEEQKAIAEQLARIGRLSRASALLKRAEDTSGASKMDHVTEDLIPIQLKSMCYSFQKGDLPFIQDANYSFPQGSLVAVFGTSSNVGVNTLLRLLGQQILPSGGYIEIPRHLRTVHVSSAVTFLGDSVWDNLCFGDPGTDRTRVLALLEEMQMKETSEHIVKPGAAQKGHESVWQMSFTFTELAKIHLARAFIMNPEVLVLQRPLMHYSQLQSSRQLVLSLIRKHVDNRGLCLPAETVQRRRPRTCFFSTQSEADTLVADVVLRVSKDGSIEALSRSAGPCVVSKGRIHDAAFERQRFLTGAS